MKAARAGHLCTVQFLISKGRFTFLLPAPRNCSSWPLQTVCVLPFLPNADVLCVCFPGANVNRSTANNDHTVVSLACAGGHLAVVELLLAHGADPTHRLKVSPPAGQTAYVPLKLTHCRLTGRLLLKLECSRKLNCK